MTKNYDFDTIIDRRNTNAIKIDLAPLFHKPADAIPLWVADMDFPTAPEMVDALRKTVNHGIFGYSCCDGEFFDAVKNWQKTEHNFEVERRWIVTTPGVVFAISCAIRAFTNAGDSVIIQTPVYYPFKKMIETNERKCVTSSLFEKNGKWLINFDDFEQKIIENKVKLFILCSPHNPVGRVWTHDELQRLSEICLKHKVIVFSDEIHNDFVFPPNKHTVFSTISKEAAQNCVVATSASKTFNLAGLQFSITFIQNPDLRKKFHEERNKTGYDEPTLMGIVATKAAYLHGKPWLCELMKYLAQNIDYLRNFLKEKLPKIRLIEPEGTYLLWLDFSALGLTSDELENLITYKAKLWLDPGTMFGEEGAQYQRINIATPLPVLKNALFRLEKAILEFDRPTPLSEKNPSFSF